MKNNELWEKFIVLDFDAKEAKLSFCQRLARENGWSLAFAERVIYEYKRFIYLVAIAPHEVTPSDQVDQAWHLHLTYTHSYWHDLCEGILGFSLHHHPTLGGAREQKRFHQQYNKTLALYRDTYGEAPPVTIWPSASKRFEGADRFIRINQNTHWIIPRLRVRAEWLFLMLTSPVILVACTDTLGETDIWFWLKTAFAIYIVYKVLQWFSSGSGGGRGSGGGSGCGGCGGGCGG